MKKAIVTDISVLRKVSVKANADEIAPIIQDLEDSLDLKRGIGLAGVQIGILKKIAIIRIGETKINLINASVIEKLDRFRFKGEGCLSLSGLKVDTIRYNNITINNNGKIETYTGLLACACLHEIQHTEGKLITDKGIIWRNTK